MEVILGREQQSRRLNVSKDGKLQVIGMPNSVPMDVSRLHVMLCSKGGDKWEIKNLNDRNVTYVNGMAVESKVITESDKIELGESRYAVSWEIIRGPKVEYIDIGSLKQIWEWYETTQLNLKESERKTQNIRNLSGILSSCGILFMFVNELGYWRIALTAFSIVIAIYFFLRGFSSDASLNVKMNELGKEFRKLYICPKCGHFMGNEPYDVLIQNGICKHCKSKFKK